MIRIAIDTATDRLALAVRGADGAVHAAHVDGARRHAAALLPTLEQLLARAGARLGDPAELVLADGPGSFTGLRVGAAVAKALAAARGTPLWTAPSLLARAVAAAPAGGGLVVALADALRGELYGGAWEVRPDGVREHLAPRAATPAALRAAVPSPDAVAGEVPGSARPALAGWSARQRLDQPVDARALLDLPERPGAARRIARPAEWEPRYGRPAEAQAKWEAEHGRALPDPAGTAR